MLATSSPDTLGPVVVATVEAYIVAHLAEPIYLHDLARVAHMGPYYFCALWRVRTGETPMQTVRRLRIDEACRLLQRGLSCRFVAAQVGYAGDAGWFGKVFTRDMGVTPGVYVRQARGVPCALVSTRA